MRSGFNGAKVLLTGNQMQKFLQRMQSDPKFAQRCKELLRSGNDRKLAVFLKKHGFRLG